MAFAKTLPGDAVEVDGDRVLAILEPSPERIEPFCKVHSICGGCKLQHASAAVYSEWKRNLVVQALAGRDMSAAVAPLLDAHGQGRRRVSLHVRQIAGAWRAGFMAEKTHDLVPLEICPVLVPTLLNAPLIAAQLGVMLGDCDVQLTAADNGIDVAVKAERQAVDKLLTAFRVLMERSGITRIAVNNVVATQSAVPFIVMGKARVMLPIGGFLQATSLGESILAELAVKHLAKTRLVMDLFSGVGPLSFRLAEKYQVQAFDNDKVAIAALEQGSRMAQGLRPIKAFTRDLFKDPMLAAELNEIDAVVLDPPRAGAEAQMRQIAKSKIRRVVSIACDVASFARDAQILVEAGFKMSEVIPVDQFKYTAHVEIFASFRR